MTITIQWSGEDDAYIARIAHTSMAAHGETVQGALLELIDAMNGDEAWGDDAVWQS